VRNLPPYRKAQFRRRPSEAGRCGLAGERTEAAFAIAAQAFRLLGHAIFNCSGLVRRLSIAEFSDDFLRTLSQGRGDCAPVWLTLRPSTKPFNGCREALLKQFQNQMPPTIKGAIMLISILNLIYREFLKSALPGMTGRGAWR
jgi:hypothetical protein